MTNQRLPEWYVNRLFYTILVVIYQMFSYYRPHPYKWVFFYYLSTFNLAFTHSGGCIHSAIRMDVLSVLVKANVAFDVINKALKVHTFWTP